MKLLKYKIATEITDAAGETTLVFTEKGRYSDNENYKKNIAIVLAESYNGEYTIEDDGEPEPSAEPTQLDRIEAQTTYTAMMTDTLLEG